VEGRNLDLSDEQKREGKSISHWVIIARRPEDLNLLTAGDTRWLPLKAHPGVKAWTDDYSDLLGVVRWR
jgi:hypothetical protein